MAMMNYRYYYFVEVKFNLGDFERIRNIKIGDGTLLPQDVRIDSVLLDVASARLNVSYYGRKKDGTDSSRRTKDIVDLSRGSGEVWLRHLLPADTPPAHRRAFEALWPNR